MGKRLKRKAGERVTLYHQSCITVFERVVSSGQMMPGGYTGYVGGGNGVTESGGYAPSGQQDGIYLKEHNDRGYNYCQDAVANNPREEGKLNFGAVFKVFVDTDALGPDLDDCTSCRKVKGTPEDPLWRKSLRAVSQCIHYGPIFLDELEGVRVDLKGLTPSTYDIRSKISELFGSDFLSIPDFAARLAELDQWYEEYKSETDESDQLLATTRLKVKRYGN